MSEEEGRFTIHLEQLDNYQINVVVSDELAQSPRFNRCKDLFEDFCVVSSSIRQGIPIRVQVTDGQGQVLHSSE